MQDLEEIRLPQSNPPSRNFLSRLTSKLPLPHFFNKRPSINGKRGDMYLLDEADEDAVLADKKPLKQE